MALGTAAPTRFLCGTDVCRVGTEFCIPHDEVCRRCEDFPGRCFTENHITNCTQVCLAELSNFKDKDTEAPTDLNTLAIIGICAFALVGVGLLICIVCCVKYRTALRVRLGSVCSKLAKHNASEAELTGIVADPHPTHANNNSSNNNINNNNNNNNNCSGSVNSQTLVDADAVDPARSVSHHAADAASNDVTPSSGGSGEAGPSSPEVAEEYHVHVDMHVPAGARRYPLSKGDEEAGEPLTSGMYGPMPPDACEGRTCSETAGHVIEHPPYLGDRVRGECQRSFDVSVHADNVVHNRGSSQTDQGYYTGRPTSQTTVMKTS